MAIGRFATLVFLLGALQIFSAQSGVANALPQTSAAPKAGSGPLTATQAVNLRSGLLAEYGTQMEQPEVPHLRRIDAKPSFNWGTSNPHPRLPSGPFVVTWTGTIDLRDDDAFRFAAFLAGEVRVEVDGTEVLREENSKQERWRESSEPLIRAPGAYRIRIVYRSPIGAPARLQLWWSGASFAPEPVPAYRFAHSVDEIPDEWRLDATREQGRIMVGQLGCAQCHRAAFPGVDDPPAGPLLSGLGDRVTKEWLRQWLEDPRKFVPHARMPVLFPANRQGFVERALVTDYLLNNTRSTNLTANVPGDHRAGRQAFVGLGCGACHTLPDDDAQSAQAAPASVGGATGLKLLDIYQDRLPLRALGDRFNPDQLTTFLQRPEHRYPDGRMPRFPISDETARNVTAYLLLWSKPSVLAAPSEQPEGTELRALADRLGTGSDQAEIAAALIKEKRCAACHVDLKNANVDNVPLQLARPNGLAAHGCLAEGSTPYLPLDREARTAIAAYAEVAGFERYDSSYEAGRRLLIRSQCFRCHQGDSISSSPIEVVGRTLWTPHLMRLPYQRTPRLTEALSKYAREHLVSSVRDGVSGVRPAWYSYKMPLYGEKADRIVEALAANDGEPLAESPVAKTEISEPTLQMLGATLAGFEGYSCVSCHIWKGQELTSVDPGSAGPELTSLTRRIRRSWFDRWLENPARLHPGTPMPAFFHRGESAPIRSVLNGDAALQRDALWACFSQGTNAAPLEPRHSIPIILPAPDEPPLVAQIPIALSGSETIETICVQFGTDDLIVYDLRKSTVHSFRIGCRILRNPNGWRSFLLSETADVWMLSAEPAVQLFDPAGRSVPITVDFSGYDPLPDGVRIRLRISAPSALIELTEEVRIPKNPTRRLVRRWQAHPFADGFSLGLAARLPRSLSGDRGGRDSGILHESKAGTFERFDSDDVLNLRCKPDASMGSFDGLLSYPLPVAEKAKIPPPPAFDLSPASNDRRLDENESLIRPGYRAIRYPMPVTAGGEDRIMPSALAVDPKSGRLFIASLKLGELFLLRDPNDNGQGAWYQDFARGLFQDAYSMLHDGEGLYLLHRRNLTRILDLNGDGVADRLDRVAALRQNAGNSYDWAYGLVRDESGAFIMSFAPYADTKNLPGMGGILRLRTGTNGVDVAEVASGLRNPFGWTAGPQGTVFFTDNQGDWVPANKLCPVVEGRNYGYPNPARPELASKPAGPTAVWVPYNWAKSINGVTYDATGGKFGPFTGQFFMAELMHGGAIVRANVEKVNGVYQGACFPFWGRGLLGPLVLAFDPRGRLFVGAITQPGWMAQPDRGALFRIEYVGVPPFEIQSIHVRPSGFRLALTKAASTESAVKPAAYAIESYRYEFSGAYGSPELDRTPLKVENVAIGGDSATLIEIRTAPLVTNRIYSITAAGIRSVTGEPLLYPTGVYTLNTVPAE